MLSFPLYQRKLMGGTRKYSCLLYQIKSMADHTKVIVSVEQKLIHGRNAKVNYFRCTKENQCEKRMRG